MLFLNIFAVPLSISFNIETAILKNFIKIFAETLPLYSIILDILFSLNTTYYSKGVFVAKRERIMKYYFRDGFLLDLMILGPIFITTLGISENNIWKLSFLFATYKIQKILAKIENFFQFQDKIQGVVNLVKLLLEVLFIAHICACFWGYLAVYELNVYKNMNNWMSQLQIQNEDWIIKYFNSLYFSIVTMATVGYGDMCPHNSLEKSFAVLTIILTCGFFAYVLNSVGIILKEMSRSDEQFKFFFLSLTNFYLKFNC